MAASVSKASEEFPPLNAYTMSSIKLSKKPYNRDLKPTKVPRLKKTDILIHKN